MIAPGLALFPLNEFVIVAHSNALLSIDKSIDFE
jgi:hypothetical protein